MKKFQRKLSCHSTKVVYFHKHMGAKEVEWIFQINIDGSRLIPITDKNRSNYVIFIYYKQQVKYYFNSYLYRELE